MAQALRRSRLLNLDGLPRDWRVMRGYFAMQPSANLLADLYKVMRSRASKVIMPGDLFYRGVEHGRRTLSAP